MANTSKDSLDSELRRLLLGVNLELVNSYRPLYLAALKGDWKAAKTIIDSDPCALTAKISVLGMNALHVAAFAGNEHFVEQVVDEMTEEVLLTVDGKGCTALHYAAMGGSIRMAKALIRKNKALTQITDVDGFVPLVTAATYAVEDKEVVKYLAMVTEDEPPVFPFTGPLAGALICSLTHAGFHDISLYLLHRYPNLATAKHSKNRHSLLCVLAQEPANFFSGYRLNFWEILIYHFAPVEVNYILQETLHQSSEHPIQPTNYTAVQWFKWLLWKVPCVKQVRDEKLKHKCALELVKQVCMHVSRTNNLVEIFSFFNLQSDKSILTRATVDGIIEIVRECLQFFPDLIWIPNPINQKALMQVAVEYRQEKIFSLMSKRTSFNKTQAYYGEEPARILHMAAKLAPYSRLSSVPGAALQMQRELQWFKVVKNFVHPVLKELEEKRTWQIFIDEHKKLQEDGEKWMKDTSNSCMIVATLITTVVFAAVFTIPGGDDGERTLNSFRKERLMMFAISDALALFFSVTSILMFLSILTSRYEPEDFLTWLPIKLTIGLFSLLLAIYFTMLLFGATLSIAFEERWKWKWISILYGMLGIIPIMFFVLQQPLHRQIINSTFGYAIFHPKKIW